jgi:hypothetical protein
MEINGSFEGNLNEISFVKHFNLNKSKHLEFLAKFNFDFKHLWMCQVNSMQFSTLSTRKVYTRADAYLVFSNDKRLENIVLNNKGYLGEDLLESSSFSFVKVAYSGVSIKIQSSNFQIIKLNPKPFFEILGCFELGAGASLFVDNLSEMPKNNSVITGWLTSIDNMNKFFNFLFEGKEVNYSFDQENCKKIKTYCNYEISRLINSSIDIQKKIFNGYSFYQEPYTAWYFSDNYTVSRLEKIPFTVTTGSGRSKGEFTIVLKPKL